MTRALWFIFLTVFLDVTGFGLIIPVLPRLIQELGHVSISEASPIGGWMAASYSIMLFLFAPIMGGLSDQFGRRTVLMLCLAAFGLDYIIQALAPNLTWLFAGRIIAGITGATYSVAGAYIADVSSAEKRAQNFGLIGAAFGLGFIVGPLLGGVLAEYGLRIPFYGAAVLVFLNFLFGFFVLPESLAESNRRKFDFRRANPFGTLKILFRFPVIREFTFVLFLTYMAHFCLQATWTYYTIEKFKWNAAMIGYSLAAVGLCTAIVQGGLTRILLPKMGTRNAVYTGMGMVTVCYMAYAFAPFGWVMFVIMVPFSLGGLASAAIQGLLSNQIPPDAQGELQGGMTSLMSLTAILGPLLMTRIFYYFTHQGAPFYFPGAPFFAASVLCTCAFVLMLRALKRVPAEKIT
ncbi:MAG: TCR/Tet family MFS transporter [Saprospiraceae bacterium]|nr:TCR/Tet family MFS transporter [Saprospiraceae bacterium]HMW38622.1 TCR/Tet family MFS transporter [Saprospiraceae bacterium]HMX88520.1 TCR/Tet family MFS transporter [Saprospiraceae bacterium]HMZ40538.1 TCR/Tet family MFS transporter [Saprospiraceae bacterium]HNA64005.1 TCR/Tet family MFS transporter [Saprospiraceae bacterium]